MPGNPALENTIEHFSICRVEDETFELTEDYEAALMDATLGAGYPGERRNGFACGRTDFNEKTAQGKPDARL